MFRPVSTALEIQGFLQVHISFSVRLTRRSAGIIEIYMRDFFVDTACQELARRNKDQKSRMDLQCVFSMYDLFLNNVVGAF